MGAVEVGLAARAPRQSDHAAFPFVRRLLLLCQNGAHHERRVGQPVCSGKTTLAVC